VQVDAVQHLPLADLDVQVLDVQHGLPRWRKRFRPPVEHGPNENKCDITDQNARFPERFFQRAAGLAGIADFVDFVSHDDGTGVRVMHPFPVAGGS